MAIIVIGPGFVASNAVTKILIDVGYFMGYRFIPRKSLKFPEAQHYPIYEDLEFSIINAALLRGEDQQAALELAINYRNKTFGNDWGFKAPNTWYPAILRHYLNYMNPIFIAGFRDKYTLLSRMMNRWNFTLQQAQKRLYAYREIVTALKKKFPIYLYQQEDFKKEEILKWIQKENAPSAKPLCK